VKVSGVRFQVSALPPAKQSPGPIQKRNFAKSAKYHVSASDVSFSCCILDTGCWILDTRCWILEARYWILDAGCWILDAGYWILDAGCWILDAGCWMLDAGYWMLDAGYWMLDTGCWIMDADCVLWAFRLRIFIILYSLLIFFPTSAFRPPTSSFVFSLQTLVSVLFSSHSGPTEWLPFNTLMLNVSLAARHKSAYPLFIRNEVCCKNFLRAQKILNLQYLKPMV